MLTNRLGVRECAPRLLGVLAALALLSLGASPASARTLDPHSFARPDEARVTDVALDLTADFSAHTLSGTATLTLVVASGSHEVVLDTKGLTIDSVRDQAGQALTFRLGPTDPVLGQALIVSLQPASTKVTIHYTTSPDAGALQRLSPAQTAGRTHPYLVSHGE
jgi:aminopeptidase N